MKNFTYDAVKGQIRDFAMKELFDKMIKHKGQ